MHKRNPHRARPVDDGVEIKWPEILQHTNNNSNNKNTEFIRHEIISLNANHHNNNNNNNKLVNQFHKIVRLNDRGDRMYIAIHIVDCVVPDK